METMRIGMGKKWRDSAMRKSSKHGLKHKKHGEWKSKDMNLAIKQSTPDSSDRFSMGEAVMSP